MSAAGAAPVRPSKPILTGSAVGQGGETEDEVGQKVFVNDQEDVIEAEEDVDELKVLPTPTLPTQSQIDDHRLDHLPYRSWCDECVEGAELRWLTVQWGTVNMQFP